ncbi:FHA domain-containing protein [Candidatus Poribacteria bacterium]|nr:FHA domain-containing protein [Candidatus Poribacteria bacterium]
MSAQPLPEHQHIIRIIAFILLLCISLAHLHTVVCAQSEKSQDTIFLIDTSSSMRGIFGDVRLAILEYVKRARLGDNFVLITFGEKVDLRVRQRISSEGDKALVERQLAGLEPDQYYTYITGALDRGMEELRLLQSRNPDHLRTVVLMTDGKNNPPTELSQPLTFDEILKRYPELLTKMGARFYYLSLGDNPDPDALAFMKSVEGSSFDLRKGILSSEEQKPQLNFAQVFVEPVSIDLGTVSGPSDTATVSLAFFPARGDTSKGVIETGISARFRDNPSWKTLLEVRPAAFNCSGKPWKTDIKIQIDALQEGTVIGTLELKPPAGQVFFIEPSEIPITVTVRQPQMAVAQEDRLEFGPIDPRRRFQETKSVLLKPNRAADEAVIQAEADLVLPDGMALTTSIEKRDDMRELLVTVATNENFHPKHSTTIAGAIHLSDAKQAIAFAKDSVEVRIEVMASEASSNKLFGALSWFGKWFKRVMAPVLIGILAVAAIAFGYRWLRSRPESALEGKLVLAHLKGGSVDRSKQRAVNLRAIGKSVGRDSLTVGSSKDAHVVLPHKSVSAHHCEIRVQIQEGNKRIFIEPIGRNSVIVNLQKIQEPTPLSDRDLIEIGAYTLRYENPQPFKQIVVKCLDGRILKGTPATWDIESDGFGLLPRDALPGSTEEIFVPFNDLKAVYFVRDFDGQIGRKIVSPASQIRGVHMKIQFHDGEEMEGFTSEVYNPYSSRFYFFPADQSGNTISLVVERQHLKSCRALDEQSQSSAETIIDETRKEEGERDGEIQGV